LVKVKATIPARGWTKRFISNMTPLTVMTAAAAPNQTGIVFRVSVCLPFTSAFV